MNEWTNEIKWLKTNRTFKLISTWTKLNNNNNNNKTDKQSIEDIEKGGLEKNKTKDL